MSQTLFQALTVEQNFLAAWQRVRSNLGAPGLDRVSIEDFEKNLHDNLALLRTMVAEGNYQPLPYLTFTHKKASPVGNSGKDRTLRIPTVRDRVVQQAILLVIQPIFEKMFLNCSYAYRPGKSSHQAIARIERNLKRGRVWIVDADIENYFDTIDRALLMKFVAETINEAPLLKLIEQCVNFEAAGEQLSVTSNQLPVVGSQPSATSNGQPATSIQDPASRKGIAQGMGLAPLLSNIYLHKMDDRMFRAAWNYIRFSDNILVLCQSEGEAKAAFARAEECTHALLLKFNPQKTSLRHLRDGFSFLGYFFDERGKRPDEPAVKRLGERVGGVLQKAVEYSENQLREKIDSIVRGWLNYFKLADTDRAKILTALEQKFVPQGGTDSLPQRILQAAIAYQLGDRDRARQTLRAAPTTEVQDAQLNYQWGLLCEALQLNNEALDSYLAAYRQNPEHPDAAYQLGLYYLQNRQPETALRYLQKAVQLNPDSAAPHFALGTALQNTGLHGAARKSLQRATELDPKINKLFPVEKPPPPAPASAAATATASPEDLEHFLRLFSGREGVFTRQWATGAGRMGYNTIYKPLTAEELRHHLSGQQTLGYYLVRSDNTVSQMVIDIDLTREVRTEIAKTTDDLAEWKNLLWADALRLSQVLQDLQLKAYPEDSGYKGIHLWLFFSAPIPARDVLLFAKKILALTGPPAPGLHREIFPKEERVAPQALGSMVKLPLGLHRLTNRRCWFLDSAGQPVTDSFAWLRQIETISANQFFTAFEKAKITLAGPGSGEPIADRTEVEKIFAGCNVLRHFKDKAEKTKWLNHVERLTLASVLGHLGVAGHQTVHEIIRLATNYNHRVTQKWLDRVKGYPISCPKIRERHSDVTPVVGCCCQFPNRKNSYPSPVLHADPELVVKIKARVAESEEREVTSDQFSVSSHQSPVSVKKPPATSRIETEISARQDNQQRATGDQTALFQDYLKLKKDQREANQKVAKIEQQLQALCEQQKSEQFATAMGTFKRIKAGGEYRWVMEI
jgi:retron-type reverse transcriptase/TPR repeat protein